MIARFGGSILPNPYANVVILCSFPIIQCNYDMSVVLGQTAYVDRLLSVLFS
jgi:hypothetical protein